MRQVLLNNNSINVQEIATPLLDENSVLVKVHYSCISSGTERATIAAQQQSLMHNIADKSKKVFEALRQYGISGTLALVHHKMYGNIQSLGYSCSGQIVAVGKNITTLRPGQWVACGGSEYAFHADYIIVPELLCAVVKEHKNIRAASMTTLGAIALQGLRRANVQLGETVAIIGMGILGQLALQLAQQAGCRVIALDLVAERLAIAEKFGAKVLYANDENTVRDIHAWTHYHGVDHTIITAASASNAIVQQAMQITRKKGKVIVVGDVGLQLERQPFYQKEIDLLISCSYGPGRYDTAYEKKGIDYPFGYVRWTQQRNMAAFVHLIEERKISIDQLITDEFSVNAADQAFAQLENKKSLGILLSYEEEIKNITPAVKITNTRHNKLRVGIIGAGGFAKITLLPLIKKQKNIVLNAIADAQITNALSTAQVYGVEHVHTDYHELLDNDLCDALVIASPHTFHAQQIHDALDHKKAVFVEKPLVTTHEQLLLLKDFLGNQTVRLCVDFNRSHAPMMQKVKSFVDERSQPMIITYRMNAGYIPYDHWTQTEIGGGRIIGEACHIIDIFHYLTGASVYSFSVDTVHNSSIGEQHTDNVIITCNFTDGSLCTLVYTSYGHATTGKERMEIFFEGKTIILDDYTQLIGHGLPKSFSETARFGDKGHSALVQEFFHQLQQETFVPPISYQRLYEVADVTLKINNLVQKGGGEWRMHE